MSNITVNIGFIYNNGINDIEVLQAIFDLLKIDTCVVNHCYYKKNVTTSALISELKNLENTVCDELLTEGIDIILDINGFSYNVQLSKEFNAYNKCILFWIRENELFNTEIYSKDYKKKLIKIENDIFDFMKKILLIKLFNIAFCDNNASLYDIPETKTDILYFISRFSLAVSIDENNHFIENRNSWHIDGFTIRKT